MGLIKKLVEKLRKRNEIFEEMQNNDRAAEKVEERKLSADERALVKVLEKRRQENVSNKLKEIYKQEESEYWHKNVISQPNIFKGGSSILKQKNLFEGGRIYG